MIMKNLANTNFMSWETTEIFLDGSEVAVATFCTPQTLLLPMVNSKGELHKVATATLEPSKKFSVASHDMKFVFASFLMIISISQSKRGGRTTLRSDSMGAKVSKWSFFKNHAQTPLSTSTGDFKRRVSQSGDGDFKALQKIFCSFP